MDNLVIRKVNSNDQFPWNLLLLADPSKEKIEEYLEKGETYIALIDNKIVGVYVLVPIDKDEIELKNIAVDENYQGKGIGKKLVLDAIDRAKKHYYKCIIVGTGNSSLNQLALYQKCGFRIIGLDKGFFTRNYTEEIVEDGIRCVDMIKLSITLV